MGVNGRHTRVVVAGYASSPTFSPDGRRLAFWRAAACKTCSSGGVIWSVRTDGTGLRKLLSDASYPAWSPDGKHIAFVRHDAAGSDVFIAGSNGHGLSQLTTSGDATAPAWSPSGKQLLVLLAASTGWQVGVVAVSNGVVHVVSRNVDADAQPAWSPDGQRIAFVRYGPTTQQLVTIAATGGDLHVVTAMIGNPTGISWR